MKLRTLERIQNIFLITLVVIFATLIYELFQTSTKAVKLPDYNADLFCTCDTLERGTFCRIETDTLKNTTVGMPKTFELDKDGKIIDIQTSYVMECHYDPELAATIRENI